MTARPAVLLEATQPLRQSCHRCESCGGDGSFGFTTRRGVLWFCLAHRADGERVLVAPDLRPRNRGQ